MGKRKVVLLYGAGGSIGNHFLDRTDEKFDIIPVYRTRNQRGLHLDFENENEVNAFNDQIREKIDGVIFSQGLNPTISFHDLTSAHFHRMLQINVVAPTLLLQELQYKMNSGCSVVFISSIAKKKGSYDPSYATAKAGLNGLMYSLSYAMSEFRFNMISLGLVKDSRVEKAMTDDFKEKHSNRMFAKELVKLEHVSSMIRELLLNTSINRSDIEIDCGYH